MDINFVPTPIPGGAPIYIPYDAERTDGFTLTVSSGIWQFEETCLFIRKYFRTESSPNRSFFDIGANCGMFTLAMACDGIRTLAVEALPTNYALLISGIRKNNINNVHPYLAAASNSTGVAFMGGDSAWGFVSDQGLQVPAISLDHLREITDIPVPALIKIDVEGHEIFVLEGASSLVDKHQDVDFVIEVFPGNESSLKFLEDRGYSCYMMKLGSLISAGAGDFIESQVTDFYCTRRKIDGATFAGTPVRSKSKEISIELLGLEARSPVMPHRLAIAARLHTAPPHLLALPEVQQMIEELRVDPDGQVRAALQL